MPLEGSSAKVPYQGSIPKESIVPDDPPTFLEMYGVVIYLMIVAGFAEYVYRPLLEKMFGELSTIWWLIAYFLYALYCFLLYFYILSVWFDLPFLGFL